MTDRPDDDARAEEARTDEVLGRAYRDAARDEPVPPAHVDAAIRAHARRAVGARPVAAPEATPAQEVAPASKPASTSPTGTPGRWRTWQPALALAATVALAVGVAIKVQDTGEADIAASPRDRRAAEAPPVAAPPAPRPTEGPTAAAPAAKRDADASSMRDARRAEPTGGGAAEGRVAETRAAEPTERMRMAAPGNEAERAARIEAPAPTQSATAPARSAASAPAEPPPPAPAASTASAPPPPPPLAQRRLEPATREESRAAAVEDEARQAARAAVPRPSAPAAQPAPAPFPTAPLADAPGAPPAPALRGPAAASAPPAAERDGDVRRERLGSALSGDRLDGTGIAVRRLEGRPAADWHAELRALVRSGRGDDARRLAREYARLFPTTPLPEDLAGLASER
jgi:hypothetical protein